MEVFPWIFAICQDQVCSNQLRSHFWIHLWCQLRGQLACGRQLGHRGYGLSCETFATQTAAIEAHAPALAVCRSAVLDYFNSPDQRGLEKIMAFEDAFELRPGRPTVALLRNLCRELSLATPNPHLELCDARSLLCDTRFTLRDKHLSLRDARVLLC